MTKHKSLWLTIMPDDTSDGAPYGSQPGTLEIRTQGFPEPTIEVAKGRRDDLFALAESLFGARHGAWTSIGEQAWSYPIQNDTGLPPPQLTNREKIILSSLERMPGQTLEEICKNCAEEPNNVGSALRSLYEDGFTVISMQDGKNTYTVRKGNK